MHFFNDRIKILHSFCLLSKKKATIWSLCRLNQKSCSHINFITGTKATIFSIRGLEWYNDASELIFSLSVDPKWEGIH